MSICRWFDIRARVCVLLLGCSAAGGTTAWAKPEIEMQIWKGGDEGVREKIMTITNGASIEDAALPKGINFWMEIHGGHDGVGMQTTSSDGIRSGWGPEKSREGQVTSNIYSQIRRNDSFFPQVGTYTITGQALLNDKLIAEKKVSFTIVSGTRPPRDTGYMKGRTDSQGTTITTSTPVTLPRLNETPKLKDNDYPFVPQKAYDVINFERFPPFKLNSKFLLIWDSARWQDEPEFGGPLNRGFTMVTHPQDFENLLINQRAYFGYPGELEGQFHDLARSNPEKYGDLLAWNLPYRSAWISPSNAYQAGWNYYNSISQGGAMDRGIFTWDEEEMWYSRGTNIFKERPEMLPADLKALKKEDPDATDPATLAAIEASYRKAWAEFLGWGYKGAIDCAASRGRKLKIYHYGSLPIGLNGGWGTSGDASAESPAPCETVGDLCEWYRKGDKVNFENNTYTRNVQYYHKDSYFFYVGPQTLSMYEKDANGNYVLEAGGRRKVRTDVAEDPVYGVPTRIGHEDYVGGPANMRDFISKQENSLYWFNGGKYYAKNGTLTSERRPLPTMRPGNQETMGQAAQLGSRPNPPYLVEANAIYNFMLGNEGFFLWDDHVATGPLAGQTPAKDGGKPKFFGDLEFMIKGLHRLSQFNKLFDGNYSFVRPARHHDIWNRNHPLIRGIINGRYLLLAMNNSFLDLDEKQEIEVWYDKPYAQRKQARWYDKVTVLPRRTHLFQCKLPAPPAGGYDPAKLYFRYTCIDGDFTKKFTVSGNYNAPYTLPE